MRAKIEKSMSKSTENRNQAICGICERPIQLGWNFCPNCGNKLVVEMGIFDHMLKEDMVKTRCELRPLIRRLSQKAFEIESWVIIGYAGGYLGQMRLSTGCGYICISMRPNSTYDLQLDNYLEGHSGSILSVEKLTLDELMETLSKNIKYVL